MTASSAKTNCAGKFGNDLGRLFEPKTLAMHQSIYKLAKIPGHVTSYIGVDDTNSEGNFVYASNGQAIPFTIPWRPNDPDGGDGQDCIGIGYMQRDGWVDLPCTYKATSICERV